MKLTQQTSLSRINFEKIGEQSLPFNNLAITLELTSWIGMPFYKS